MANNRMSESERNARYLEAMRRFSQATDWRTYLALAEEFRAMDTYKDAAQKVSQCVKAASAPAYREVQAQLATPETKTADDYREAARVMTLIQEYQDARELARAYTVKANILVYEQAVRMISDSEASTEQLGRAVDMLKGIRSFRNARELIERYERYYCERMYAEGTALMNKGHVWSEFDEAADIFERIAGYGDAAELATACRKKANRMRPSKRAKEKASVPSGTEDATAASMAARTAAHTTPSSGRKGRQVHADRQKSAKEADRSTPPPKSRGSVQDETVNTVLEVFRDLDKRRLVLCLCWLVLFVATLVASVRVGLLAAEDDQTWIARHIRELRIGIAAVAFLSGGLCVREFLFMLTRRMRRDLAQALARFAKRMTSPMYRVIVKLLRSIGIDLTRRHRLGGRDEKAFVFEDTSKGVRKKKKLKNTLAWADQEDNVARVRFLFIDYMIHKIKGGYLFHRTTTPAEMQEDLTLAPEEKELLKVYQMARYAAREDANQDISPATVVHLKESVQRRRYGSPRNP